MISRASATANTFPQLFETTSTRTFQSDRVPSARTEINSMVVEHVLSYPDVFHSSQLQHRVLSAWLIVVPRFRKENNPQLADGVEFWLLKISMYGTRDVASNWECNWQEHVNNWGFRLGLSSKNLFHQEGHQVSGLTQWRRLHAHGTDSTAERI